MLEVIRIMAVDDSAVMRRILHEIISAEADLQVIATAENGEQAIALFRAEQPDVVLMDVEMPGISSVQALKSIRAMDRRIPVVMFTPPTVRAGGRMLEAVCSGASDFALKPPDSGHVMRVIGLLRKDLIPQLRFWGQRRQQMVRQQTVSPEESKIQTGSAFDTCKSLLLSPERTPGIPSSGVVVIGAPENGIAALCDLISRLPGDLAVPVVVAQRLPECFMQSLEALLDRSGRLNVCRAVPGTVISPGRIFLMDGSPLLEIVWRDDQFQMQIAGPSSASAGDAVIDSLFYTAAKAFGRQAVALVFNGRTDDGVAGCAELKRSGATVIVQNQGPADYWNLPDRILKASDAHGMLTIEQMAKLLAELRSASA